LKDEVCCEGIKSRTKQKTRGYRTAQAKSSLKRKAKMIAFKKEDQKFRTTKNHDIY
jgi:hypothetical protein